MRECNCSINFCFYTSGGTLLSRISFHMDCTQVVGAFLLDEL